MNPVGLDHLVLTVASVGISVRFYRDVLGLEEITFGNGRKAVRCGSQKINFHQAGAEVVPHAAFPVCGSGDICLVYGGELEKMVARLMRADVVIEHGPVERTGANGPIRSIYVRDPDGNLVELSVYHEPKN